MQTELVLALHFSIIAVIFLINLYKIFSINTRIFLIGLGLFEGFNSFLKLGSYLPSEYGFLVLLLFVYLLHQELDKLNIAGKSKFINIPLINLFPFIGTVGILAVYTFNVNYDESNFGSNDSLAILFCLILIIYKKINFTNPYIVNFTLICLFIANLLLVLPRLILLIKGDFNILFDNQIVYLFLNIPVNKVLTILGYDVFSDSSILKFYTVNGDLEAVNIGRTCSGLHSVAIFISAFTTYSYLENYSFDSKTMLFSIIGICVSYFANLLRMIIIVLVGIHIGFDAMIWVHEHLGWLIFTTWVFFILEVL